MAELPASLKTWVSLFFNKDIIEKVPLFEGSSEEFIKEIIMNLIPGDYIVTAGELGFDSSFIKHARNSLYYCQRVLLSVQPG